MSEAPVVVMAVHPANKSLPNRLKCKIDLLPPLIWVRLVQFASIPSGISSTCPFIWNVLIEVQPLNANGPIRRSDSGK